MYWWGTCCQCLEYGCVCVLVDAHTYLHVCVWMGRHACMHVSMSLGVCKFVHSGEKNRHFYYRDAGRQGCMGLAQHTLTFESFWFGDILFFDILENAQSFCCLFSLSPPPPPPTLPSFFFDFSIRVWFSTQIGMGGHGLYLSSLTSCLIKYEKCVQPFI